MTLPSTARSLVLRLLPPSPDPHMTLFFSQQIEVLRSRHTEITSQLATTSDIDLARQAEIGSLQKALMEREAEFSHTQTLCKQYQQQIVTEKNETQRCQKEMSEAAAAFKLQVMNDNYPVVMSFQYTLLAHPVTPK